MALINLTTGEYHKVGYFEDNTPFHDRIFVDVYKDTEHRQQVIANFEKDIKFIKREPILVFLGTDVRDILIKYPYDNTKDTESNYKTAVYNHIKQFPMYNGFIDA